MKTINEILNSKKQNVDCSENESAELKGFIREELGKRNLAQIILLFPQEFDEVLNENWGINELLK